MCLNNNANKLYENDGSGSFADIADTVGVDDSGKGRSANFVDFDGDGKIAFRAKLFDGKSYRGIMRSNGHGTPGCCPARSRKNGIKRARHPRFLKVRNRARPPVQSAPTHVPPTTRWPSAV